MGLSRRGFLKGMAATAMGAAVSGIVNTQMAKSEGAVYDWAEAADVVVVGGGGVGFCAVMPKNLPNSRFATRWAMQTRI